MFNNRFRLIVVFLLSLLLLTEVASAQLFRRSYRRPGVPRQSAAPRQDTTRSGPLMKGDGRLLERARGIVNLLTESGTELKPVAVISLAGFDEFKRVVEHVAQAVRLDHGSAQEPVLLNRFLEVYQRVASQGFATDQPVGMILQTDGILYYPLFFTPLDLESEFGDVLKNRVGERLPDGRFVLRQEIFPWPFGRLYLEQKNGWTFIATEAQLNALPEDPTVLLQGLDREHLAAARFDLHNIPPLTTRAALAVGEMNAVAQAESEVEKAGIRLWIGYLRSLAEQSDFLEYSLTYDEEHNDYVIRQKEIVRPNTERAELLQRRREAVSRFHSFHHPEKAVFASHLVMYLTQSQREQLEIILDETIGRHLLTPEERAVLKRPPDNAGIPRRNRTRSLQDENAGIAPKNPPAPESMTLGSETSDPRDRLADLLSQVPCELLEQIEHPTAADNRPEKIPDLVLSDIPEQERTDSRKLEVVLRRIGAAYYWALIGAVRNGTFDGAWTCSLDHGLLAGFHIVDGDRFRNAFDSIFDELTKKFPDAAAFTIQKDYAEYKGFLLTKVTFQASGLAANFPWFESVPPASGQAVTTLVLAVRDDAVCLAVGRGDLPEERLCDAIYGMEQPLPVNDLFFAFSAYELGRALATVGNPDRLSFWKVMASHSNPAARAFAESAFTDTTKTITLRISGLLTPSLWRLRENLRELRSNR